jgi:FimV-like protein
MAYAQIGEREKAIADLEKVLELSRDSELRQEAEALLKKLK